MRLATHSNFREFVTGEGLEFYPLGGDPKVLAECKTLISLTYFLEEIDHPILSFIFGLDMVKNKGFLPSRPADVSTQRKQLKAIINSTWPACTEADTESNGQPFVADAIIANPPTLGLSGSCAIPGFCHDMEISLLAYSFPSGHTHVAEALKIPLHVFFTMPWT